MAGRNLRGQDVRRSRITPAANRGRNLNIPSVRYAAPIEEPEEIEMGLVGLARFDGAPRQGRRLDIEEDVNIRQVNDGEDEAEEVGARGPQDWTIVQAWTVFGYGTLTLPSFVSYDAASNEYVLKSNVIQKMACFVQHGLAMVDVVMRIGEISELVKNNPTPFTFIQISSIFVSIGTCAWFFKVVFMNMKYMQAYHNATSTGTYLVGRRRRNGKLSFVACAGFTIFMVGLEMIILLNAFTMQWKQVGGPAVIQTFACYGRRSYLWRDYSTCRLEYLVEKYSQLPTSEILFAIQGFITFISAKICLYQKIVGLDAINAIFYMDASNAMDEIREEDAPVRAIYDNLKRRADFLSSFAGPLLMMQLVDIGMNIPLWSEAIFYKNVPVTMFIILMVLGFYFFVFLSCIGAQTCERIRDEMMGSRGEAERPYSGREMIMWLVNSVWNKVGIGFTGIYVLNFACFMTYMTFVGAWIMVLYEVEH